MSNSIEKFDSIKIEIEQVEDGWQLRIISKNVDARCNRVFAGNTTEHAKMIALISSTTLPPE